MSLIAVSFLRMGRPASAFSAHPSRRISTAQLFASSKTAKPFGRQDYWESRYNEEQEDFCWYSEWSELQPFVAEWIEPSDRLLIPGIGTDAALLRGLIEASYTSLHAFDYAQSGVDYCRSQVPSGVHLRVTDARDLSAYDTASMDAILDKGTLDAVFLAGSSVEERRENLSRAVSELQRVLAPGGIFWSLSGICTEALVDLKCWNEEEWKTLTDGSLYTTDDGYTSNNLDGALLVWKKTGR